MLNLTIPIEPQLSAILQDGILDLSSKNLGNLSAAELALIFFSIPNNTSHINLENNNLGKLSGKTLKALLAMLPTGVISLNLDSNFLNELSAMELATAISVIPVSVTSLSIDFNYLENSSNSDFATVINEIPKSITTMTLWTSAYPIKSAVELRKMAVSIPVTIANLISNSQMTDKYNEVRDYDAMFLTIDEVINKKTKNYYTASNDISKIIMGYMDGQSLLFWNNRSSVLKDNALLAKVNFNANSELKV